jgi:arylsulfatase A-like enzyme
MRAALASGLLLAAAAASSAVAAATATATATTSAAPPHIVFVLTDDMGFRFYPRTPETKTPALDALADEGLIVPEFYTFQFCSPSRASFLTGRYPWRQNSARVNLIPAYILDGVDLRYTMLPARLAAAGYVSAHVGKWHQVGF